MVDELTTFQIKIKTDHQPLVKRVKRNENCENFKISTSARMKHRYQTAYERAYKKATLAKCMRQIVTLIPEIAIIVCTTYCIHHASIIPSPEDKISKTLTTVLLYHRLSFP
ncbi:hypothetical protein T4B_6750 [Trichinella pseudospiralis]|uniref:Uncharacterized protein n=1 Tax=Trichinella pseudospiralis TaxID=6337 RepID=A0A0V1IVX9_TRIPS|nr:hypothetical protein T4B_6750 [Trichinella pseudospiralis]KRZ40615.1 hypothetical protein T4C_3419 [Trichinella pseudospiralis]